MKRRLFLKSSLLSASLTSVLPILGRAATKDIFNKNANQEFYELRIYTCKTQEQENVVVDYLEKAAIPALNRLGNKNIGVFKVLKPEATIRIFVIIPFQTIEAFIKVEEKLLKDEVYKTAASAYLNAPATEPAYDRIESSLLKAFSHMPKIEVPEKKQRLFELRRYESASEGAGKMKIEMFNQAGEIDIFKKVGFKPVFFGKTIVGTMLPNLTYMITFDDMADHDKKWKAFGSDPQWKKISTIPEYADAKIVSRITSTILVPTPFSQI
jgi:hypothetical protein